MDELPGFCQKFNEMLEEREVQFIGSMKPNLKVHQIKHFKSLYHEKQTNIYSYLLKIKISFRAEDHYTKSCSYARNY